MVIRPKKEVTKLREVGSVLPIQHPVPSPALTEYSDGMGESPGITLDYEEDEGTLNQEDVQQLGLGGGASVHDAPPSQTEGLAPFATFVQSLKNTQKIGVPHDQEHSLLAPVMTLVEPYVPGPTGVNAAAVGGIPYAQGSPSAALAMTVPGAMFEGPYSQGSPTYASLPVMPCAQGLETVEGSMYVSGVPNTQGSAATI